MSATWTESASSSTGMAKLSGEAGCAFNAVANTRSLVGVTTTNRQTTFLFSLRCDLDHIPRRHTRYASYGPEGGQHVGQSNGLLDQAMQDRLCSLAHELNNALAAIAGHSELILEHAEPGSECNKRLRQILTIAHAMARRINGHECRMSSAGAPGTLDPDVLLSSIQSSARASQSTNPTASKSPKEG
jgi:hypothetical protein